MTQRRIVLILTLALTASLVSAGDYVSRIAEIAVMSGDMRARAITEFVRNTGKDEDTAEAATQALENSLLSATSPMRDDELYIAFVEEMLCSGYPNRVRNQWMLNAVKLNRPGSMLPQFDYETRDGVRHTSDSLRGCVTVLMFYDPDCSDCAEAIARIQNDNRLADAISRGKLHMICVYADGDRDAWLAAPDKIPAGWTDGFDTGRIAGEELFVIPMTPAIYIVGADGKILRKEALVEDVLSLQF